MEKFLYAAQKAGDWLHTDFARPGNKTFFCRVSSKKDMCNGLIGQAWPIEGLLHLHDVLPTHNYLDIAAEVYRLHPYERSYGLYRVVECDGRVGKVGKTLNHQLIFAATGVGLMARGYMEFQNDLTDFYHKLKLNMFLTKKGLIHHFASFGRSRPEKLLFNVTRGMQRQRMLDRSIGYQSFNMYGLALAARFSPGDPVWRMGWFRKTLALIYGYATSDEFLQGVLENDFALAYRLTGQEILFFKQVFGMPGSSFGISKLVECQFERHWDSKRQLLCKKTGDPNTLSSRLYEMWYLYEDRCVEAI